MFERYTEPSRRIIFFARYEASCLGSPFIELEHLFLGIARQSKDVLVQTLGSSEAVDATRVEIEARSKVQRASTITVDLPLSRDAKHALAYAAEEARHDKYIRPEHLLLGLLRLEDSSLARILREHGVTHRTALEQLAHGSAKLETTKPAAPSLETAVARLRQLVAAAGKDLAMISDRQASIPAREGGWSPKQVLGHLIDSASNNHQRFVRALLQPELEWPNYEQEGWVNAQRYHAADWETLVKLWVSYNRHLLWIILKVPEEKLATICRIGDNQPITLGELINGYMDHMQHHLEQIQRPTGISTVSGL